MSVTYNLLEGVLWSDGSAFTADDVVFAWEYCADVLTGCSSFVPEAMDSVEALDELTVRVNFNSPQPFPFIIFAGYTSPIISQRAPVRRVCPVRQPQVAPNKTSSPSAPVLHGDRVAG